MPRGLGSGGGDPGPAGEASAGASGAAPSDSDAVSEFVRAFNERDLDGFVAALDPEVELHSQRGLRRGLEQARAWATRAPGGVQQTIVVLGRSQDGDRVLLEIDRRWDWAEDGSHATTDEMAWLFDLRGGKVLRWRPFEDRSEARAALGADG